MTTELIERLAREAGTFEDLTVPDWITGEPRPPSAQEMSNLARFSALVAAECAGICDAAWGTDDPQDCAAEIRAKFPMP